MRHSRITFLLAFCLQLSLTVPLVAQDGRRIADDHRFGCKSEEYCDKLTQYAVAKDVEAFKKALMAGVLLGQCIFFEKGEEVVVMDTRIFSGRVKVHRKGKIEEYWTVFEAVK